MESTQIKKMNKVYTVHEFGRIIAMNIFALISFLVFIILSIILLVKSPDSPFWIFNIAILLSFALYYTLSSLWSNALYKEISQYKNENVLFEGNLLSNDHYENTMKNLRLNIFAPIGMFAIIKLWRIDREFLTLNRKRLRKLDSIERSHKDKKEK